jgi:methylated-DNA-[protein]-cysteine S-methyltransferase
MKQQAYYKSPLGWVSLESDGVALTSVRCMDSIELEATEILHCCPILQQAIQQLDEYFAGTRQVFNLPLGQKGTLFQQKVWQNLLNIPYGTTISYLHLSRIVGDEKAIRAVGTANGKNQLWIIVPCHRVIGADGSLTGYAGGIWRKSWLLEHEKKNSGQLTTQQMSLFS